MKSNYSALAGIVLQIFCVLPAEAQPFSDSSLYQHSVSSLRQLYFNEIGDNAAIYHGSEYISNGQRALGFPYYESDSMVYGTVSYQGTLYENQKLFYNLVADEIIISNYDHDALIILSTDKLDSFIIGNRVFVRLKSENSNAVNKDGFYEKLFPGEPGLYVRREKKLDVGSGNLDIKYIQYNTYFIKLKNAFYPVDSKNSMMDIFRDHEDELKKYSRASKLNFKKDLERALLLSTIYYSQLKN